MGAGIIPGDLSPELDELQGRERPVPATPVAVEGPVEVRQLPNRSSATRSQFVTSSEPVRLLHADLTRSRALIRAKDQPVYLAFTREEAAGTDGFYIASTDPPLPIFTAAEIWVRAVTTSTTVSAISENWTN